MTQIIRFEQRRRQTTNTPTNTPQLQTYCGRNQPQITGDFRAIYYATEAYRKEVERCPRIDLSVFPADYEQLLVDRNYYLPDAARQEIQIKFSRSQRAQIVIEMIRAIRDGWVRDYADRFDTEFRNWEFYYLPLEMRGIRQFERDLAAIQHALPRFGLLLDGEDTAFITQEFCRLQRAYWGEYNLHDVSSLMEYVTHLKQYYPAVPDAIALALQERKLAFDVVRQVVYYSPEIIEVQPKAQRRFRTK